jgi:site-specific DNA recombinase
MEMLELLWLQWRSRLVDVITAELYQLDGFDAQYAELVRLAMHNDPNGITDRREALRRDEVTLQKERENMIATIKSCGPRPMLLETLDELEMRATKLANERQHLERLSQRKLVIPESTSELRGLLQQEFQRLAVDSPEFGDLLRLLVPEFHVYLVRLCDGGKLLPRARVKLNLAGSITDADQVLGLQEKLSRTVTIDLFDLPTQREAIREEAVQLAAHGLTHRQIAAQLPGSPTTTAVTNALALDKQLKALGLTSPYLTVLEPPADFSKLRRHKNAKYQFQPLNGYKRPAI